MSEGDSDTTQRPDGRAADQLRTVTFKNNIAPYATGSTLIEWGDTRVICSATVEESVPRWMKLQNVEGGWLTAEYSMLPYSTLDRKQRDISKGKIDGRSQEIQRLIGRSMRAAVDLVKLGSRTLWIDCDVLQADGGTRTASICGGYVALHDAFTRMVADGTLPALPILDELAAISVGIVDGSPLLDLPYSEDSTAEVDFNVVMTGSGRFVEVQGTAEGRAFDRSQLDALVDLAATGISRIVDAQRAVLADPPAARP